jgi:hypothetical protein
MEKRLDMSANRIEKSLAEKLGIREGSRIIILNPPNRYYETLGKLPKRVSLARTFKGPLDFIHFFTKERVELERMFPILKRELSESGMLWISWPKGSSKTATDLNEAVVREIGLKYRLVDVKVIAVDEIWSGLKFVYRTEDRE